MKYDVVIPYDGNGESLVYALRSIDKYIDYNNVYLVTTKPPTWIKNVTVLNCPDKHQNNKDANLFDKVLFAIDNGLDENFLFWSDDQVVIDKFEPLPVINCRNPLKINPQNKWERRLQRTGLYLRDVHNVTLQNNYDSHVPQPMKSSLFQKIKNIDYQTPEGYCICTLYFGLNKCENSWLQTDVKATFESIKFNSSDLIGKKYIGWNERNWNSELGNYIKKTFNERCNFERSV